MRVHCSFTTESLGGLGNEVNFAGVPLDSSRILLAAEGNLYTFDGNWLSPSLPLMTSFLCPFRQYKWQIWCSGFLVQISFFDGKRAKSVSFVLRTAPLRVHFVLILCGL